MEEAELIQHDIYAGMQVRYQSAPRMKRIVAYATDVSIIGVIFYASIMIIGLFSAASFAFLSQFLTEDFAAINTGAKILAILMLLIVLLYFMSIYHGYFIWYEYKKGRTPGKKIFGLSVISLDGKKLSLSQCIFRDVMRYIDCSLVLPGLISIFLSKRGQRLGDMAAGTLVIYSQSQEDANQFLYISRDDYLLVLPYITVREMSDDLARTYLTFAFSEFIQVHSKSSVGDEDRVKWQEFAREQLQFKEGFSLSPKDQQLFLAEYYHQHLRGK